MQLNICSRHKTQTLFSGPEKCQDNRLTLCVRESPKQVLLQTVKTQMKCSIMLHFIRVYTVCKYRQSNTIICFNYNLTSLDMYNGSHQARRRVRKRAKIRNRYNQVSHQTQDTNGKVTNLRLRLYWYTKG